MLSDRNGPGLGQKNQVNADLPMIGMHGEAHGIGWDMAPPNPYDLRFANASDVVCLLFGAIEARTGYDGAKPSEMRFEGLTCAFHPGGGEVVVHARRVHAGFVAFTFPREFRLQFFGADAHITGATRSVDNIVSPTVARLVAYARTALASNGGEDRLIVESLAQLAYSEAMQGIQAIRQRAVRNSLSAKAVARLIDFIDSNIDQPLGHADLARLLDLPIATLRRQFLERTGRPLHQFIIERRLTLARDMLHTTDLPISEIAAACGFCSQQHMTTAFTNRLGVTPKAFRQAN